jgi:hypothetical protein
VKLRAIIALEEKLTGEDLFEINGRRSVSIYNTLDLIDFSN